MPNVKKSIFWASVEQLGPKVVGFVISIILARLLTPRDYGLIGMLAVFTAFARLFADSGMSQALIQRKQNSDDDTKSVFILNIITGILLSIILCAISPLAAKFFREPRLIEIMCVVSINFIISSFGIVQYTLLSRELDLKKTAVASFISTFSSGTVSILMAAKGLGVWSLVGGGLSGNFSRVVALWVLSTWKPSGKFSWESIRSIWKYSINLLGAGLFTTFVDNLSNVLIGRSYSAASLGLYNRSYTLQNLPVSLFTGVINRVAFPVFSRNQDNQRILLNQMRRSVKSSVFMVTFVCILLSINAKELIPWLLGEKWNGAIIYLQILAVTGIFYPVNVLMTTMIKATGRSDLFFRVEIIKKIIIMVTLLIAVRYSVEAMAWSLIGTGAMAYYFNARFVKPLIHYKWKMQFSDLLPNWILIGGAAIITNYITNEIHNVSYFGFLIIKTTIYSMLIFISLFIFRKSYFYEVWNFAINTISDIKYKASLKK